MLTTLPLLFLFAAEPVSADAFADRVVAKAPEIDAARARADEAKRAADSVRAAFVPTLDVTVRATRIFQPDNGALVSGLPPAGTFDDGVAAITDPAAQAVVGGIVDQLEGLGGASLPVVRNQAVLSLRLTIPISDVFTTIAAAHREARAGAKAQQAVERSTEAEIRLRALEAYYGFVRANALADVAAASVDRVSSQVELVGSARRLGSATDAEVLAMRARLAEAEIDRLGASAGVDTAAETLRVLGEFSEDAEIATRDVPELVPLRASLSEFKGRARTKRHELSAVRAQTQARAHALSRAKWERAPKVALIGNLDTARPNPLIVPLDDGFASTGDASVVVTWSPNVLLSGARTVKSLRSSVRASNADRAALERAVDLEVSQAFHAYRSAHEISQQADAFVSAAEARYAAESARVKGGTATVDTLLDADTDVTRAQAARVDARAAVHLARARLERAVGELRAEDFQR
ncbi:MAG: TolC family protein [Nannocystales bacterium]